jgi:hypothetical protein
MSAGSGDWEEVLSPEEFARREREGALRLEQSDDAEQMLELMRWFTRRYPTPLERLKYIRRQTRDVLASQAYRAK